MQLTKICRDTADACRFCWMCRHICPIGNVTGQERNTARARGLSVSLAMRGTIGLEGDIADNMYECALCSACTEDCATGWDPVIFTRECRKEVVLSGKAPEYVNALLEKFGATGSIYGAEEENAAFAAAAKAHADKTDMLFYIGEDARHGAKAQAAEAIALLEKANVKFTVLENEPVSGRSIYFLCGDVKEARDIMSAANDCYNSFKKVVFYDSGDAKTAKQEAKELGISAGSELVSFPAFLAELIENGAIAPKKGSAEYSFQDPAALARGLEDVESGRKVLSACGTLKDMMLVGKATVVAGHRILNEYIPLPVKLMAEKRWADAAHIGSKLIVTADSGEYMALAANKPEGAELLTIEEAVLKCL